MRKLLLAGVCALALPVVAASMVVAQDAENTDQDAVLTALAEEGQPLFRRNCAACHGNDGEGGAGPQLDGNPAVGSRATVVGRILWGYAEHGMPAFGGVLDDHEVAAIATYIRNTWSNEFGITTEEQVARFRAAGAE